MTTSSAEFPIIETKKFRITQCKACQNSVDNEIFTAKNMRSSEKETFQFIHCRKCFSVSILDVPDNLSKYYENYYSFGPVGNKDSFLKKIAKKIVIKNSIFFSKLSSKLLTDSSDLAYLALRKCKLGSGTTVLDVGCGTGQMVFDLYNLGFKNVIGIDPFLEANIIYPNGSRVFKRSIFEETGSWDVIMLHHVFEHMDNPNEILKKIKTLLSPNGIAVIRIPNVDSYAFRKFRQNWYGIQAPVHLILPSISAMTAMIEKNSLKILEIVGENILEFWGHSIAYSLDIWDYDRFGMRTFLMKNKPTKAPPFISKKELSALKNLNAHIMKSPHLCDWLTYYIGHSS